MTGVIAERAYRSLWFNFTLSLDVIVVNKFVSNLFYLTVLKYFLSAAYKIPRSTNRNSIVLYPYSLNSIALLHGRPQKVKVVLPL